MRTVHVIRHAHGTTVQVEDKRVFVPLWGRQPAGTRYRFLPTATSLRRLRRVVLASWKIRSAHVTTYTEGS